MGKHFFPDISVTSMTGTSK